MRARIETSTGRGVSYDMGSPAHTRARIETPGSRRRGKAATGRPFTRGRGLKRQPPHAQPDNVLINDDQCVNNKASSQLRRNDFWTADRSVCTDKYAHDAPFSALGMTGIVKRFGCRPARR